MLVALLQLKLVEFRLCLTPDNSFLRADDVEHDDFVLALLQPAAGHVERLLRAYRPDAAHGVTVYVDLTLAPRLEVEECVAYLLQRKVAAVVAGLHDVAEFLRPLIALCKGECRNAALHLTCCYLVVDALYHVKCLGGCLVVIGDGHIHPVLWRQHHLNVVFLRCQRDVAYDALEVLDGTAEVDAPHAFDDDNQFGSFLHGRDGERLLVLHAVNLTNIFVVDKHLGEVVELAGEHALRSNLGQASRVHHRAPAHIHLLEGLGCAIDGLGHGGHEGCELRQLELRHGDDRHRGLGHGGHLLTIVVLLHHFA